MKSQSTGHRVLAACLGTILLAGIVPSIAAAATPTVTRYRFNDLFAEFGFSSSSDSIATTVQLTAFQGGGTPNILSFLATQDNFLTGSSSCYFSGDAPLTGSQFQITKSLQSASLDVTGMVLYDCFTGDPGPTADVSVTWTGSGGTFGFNSTDTSRSGVFVRRERASGLFRNATATVSVVIDGTNFLTGTPSGDRIRWCPSLCSDYNWVDLGQFKYALVEIMKLNTH
jgi:hypothetical protein